MSVEFSNAYQEILLDNLMAVIKQNFVFQTQLKLAENSSKINEELKSQLERLSVSYNEAKNQLSQLDVYKTKAESNSSAHEEKSRIQSALNDLSKKHSNLERELENKNNEISKLLNERNKEIKSVTDAKDKEIENIKLEVNELKSYIQKLEEIAPASKLKKLSPEKETVVFEEKNDTTKIENKIQKVLDGSTF
jgi:chromosome segregation ATPase